jgi:ATP-dependent helicase HrpA
LRLAGRARKALAGAARAQFGREGLTTWDFEELPERFELDRGGVTVVAFPALADRGECAALTLAETEAAASASTHRGVRRLLALACKDEVGHRLGTIGGAAAIESMYKWFAPLGPPAELRAALIDLIVERAFLYGQPAIRTREAFDQRQTANWGRLGQATIEVATGVARILESRHKVAAKLGSGVPRTWAVSVADIREHAAYLMPKGFLTLVPRERLAEYPRYVEAMWLRLTKLREDGSPREARALAELAPHWKRYTGWVARQASEAKAREAEHAGPEAGGEAVAGGGGGGKPGKGTLALPAARRAAPVVPTEAAAWAARPGSLPPAVEAYRWMLEEFRVSLFAQELGTALPVSGKRLDEQWGKVGE